MDKLLEPLFVLLARNRSNKWFVAAILAAYAAILILLIFVPDAAVKGTALKDTLLSAFDISTSVGAFLIGTKLGN